MKLALYLRFKYDSWKRDEEEEGDFLVQNSLKDRLSGLSAIVIPIATVIISGVALFFAD